MNRDRWISARANANVKLASLNIIYVELKPSLAITYNKIKTFLQFCLTVLQQIHFDYEKQCVTIEERQI